MVRLRDVQYEHHAVHAAPFDARRAVHDAGVVVEAVAVGRLATALEKSNIVVAQRVRVLRVGVLAA